MNIKSLSAENKKELLSSPKYIIKFFATWCGPCKLLAPVAEAASKEVDVPFVAVDVDVPETKDIVHQYEIKSVPQMVYVVDGKEVGRVQGFLNKDKIIEFVESH